MMHTLYNIKLRTQLSLFFPLHSLFLYSFIDYVAKGNFDNYYCFVISQATLNTSIAMTEESLPKDTREFFRWLVVFDEDVIIRAETLATIWDVNKYDAVDIMNGKRRHRNSNREENEHKIPLTIKP